MKHTPAPWHTGDIGRKGLGWCTIFSGITPIARALSIHKNGERKSADFDIEAANAKLIAAAPELLARLVTLEDATTRAIEYLESHQQINQDALKHSTWLNITKYALENARAAIAKVTS